MPGLIYDLDIVGLTLIERNVKIPSTYINKDYQFNETTDYYSVKFNIENFKAIGLIIKGRGTILKIYGYNKI